jgi:hypothetical protein
LENVEAPKKGTQARSRVRFRPAAARCAGPLSGTLYTAQQRPRSQRNIYRSCFLHPSHPHRDSPKIVDGNPDDLPYFGDAAVQSRRQYVGPIVTGEDGCPLQGSGRSAQIATRPPTPPDAPPLVSHSSGDAASHKAQQVGRRGISSIHAHGRRGVSKRGGEVCLARAAPSTPIRVSNTMVSSYYERRPPECSTYAVCRIGCIPTMPASQHALVSRSHGC